jgi:hypothetical protein
MSAAPIGANRASFVTAPANPSPDSAIAGDRG